MSHLSALWTPSEDQIQNTRVYKFLEKCSHNFQFSKTIQDLYTWSIDDFEAFWSEVWDFTGVVGEKGTQAYEPHPQFHKCRFFPEAQLNYAENLLRPRADEAEAAIIYQAQDHQKRTLTFAELRAQVSRAQQYLKDQGIKPGDRIGAVMPNSPETIIFMLAATSLGAVFSSCSPDFALESLLDRFSQVEPKILLVTDGYRYKTTIHSLADTIQGLRDGLPSLEKLLISTYDLASPIEESAGERFEEVLKAYEPKPLTFTRLPFDHPLFIMFSSGTTGKPKCIVHGAGGTLLQHLKEHQLHCDIQPKDRLMYFTTTGWMMWNWQVSALASGAALLLYEGNPFSPKKDILFQFVEEEKCTHFGTSAKYLDACEKFRLHPAKSFKLEALRMILSTGSPLLNHGFRYVYEKVKSDLCLASISGGTDIISCFALGSPVKPVYPGQLQMRGLGMAVDVWDEYGKPLRGEKGELVCTKPFPSKPTGFLNDEGDEKYLSSYFELYPNVWAHGDFVEITPEEGMIFHGRSDATLNPGGVRIGTAEIYRQVEQVPEVLESAAVGQRWKGDTRIVLFVVLKDDLKLDLDLERKIKTQIRENTTPRHVPAEVFQVSDLPRTTNGKLSEIAVSRVLNQEPLTNRQALQNPESLDEIEKVAG